jgi:uncharacterized lipoprotein YmbA
MKRGSHAMRWPLAGTVAACALLLGGCASSPEPQFYTLFPSRGADLESRPLQIQLRRPGLPGYLDRPQIVRQERAGELELSDFERWGAPLEDMVGSILAQNLAERLPKARVFTEASGISAVADTQIEIDIQRFELTAGGSVELVAQVALHWPRALGAERLDRFAFSRSPKDGSTLQLVVQMSGLLAELSDAIAGGIAESMASPNPAGSNPAGSAEPPEQ